jgi:hypothetical protein
MSSWDAIGWVVLGFLVVMLLRSRKRSFAPARSRPRRRMFESDFDFYMRTSPDPMCDPVRGHFDWRGKLKRKYRGVYDIASLSPDRR